MTRSTRHGRCLVAVVCAVLGSSAVARAQSAVDGFDPGANGNVYAMVLQPDGKILVGGAFTALGGGTGTTLRSRIGRLNHDGSLDAGFTPGANGDVYVFVLQPDGKILVGGDFTTLGGMTRNRIGRLNANGSLDTTFDPGADALVYTMAVQPDGKILVGGVFSTLGGGTRNRIGRLDASGALDTGFNPGANDFIYTFSVQPGGQILVGGAFTMMGGGGLGLTPRNRIARLNADGSLDPTYAPGTNDWVLQLVRQPDGRILVAGSFTLMGGSGTTTMPRSRLGRLNPDGSLDASFDPGANAFVLALSLQEDGKILLGGGFTTLGGGGNGTTPRTYLGRLHADGLLDTSFSTAANSFVYAVPVQPDGQILIGGNFTTLSRGFDMTMRNRMARLNGDGSLDATMTGSANGNVYALAMQPDGKILVGGFFSTLGANPLTRNRLARFNADGTLDAFDPGANGVVFSLAVQPDGRILVAGGFTMLGGGGSGTTPRSMLGRLNADGSIDDSFDPGADDYPFAMAVQPDGKILVGGQFTMLGGGGAGLNARQHVGRLNAGGTLDALFDPGADNDVYTLAVQADGKILVGGAFTMLGGGGTGTTPRSFIGRLNADGMLDTSFDPGANGDISNIVVQPDGKILVAGGFTRLGGGGTGTTPHASIGRLNADGSVDNTFNPGANAVVYAMALQADGKVLVGGEFTALREVATGFNARNYIGRFAADGSLDASFNPGADDWVYGLAMQADGKILTGGIFTTLGGGGTGTTMRGRIGRLTNTGTAIQSLSVSSAGGVVTWARSGVGPEVSRVTFESSTDGATYTPLGSGTRVPGGWRLSGLTIPARQNFYIRARGLYSMGSFAASGSIVESIALKTYQLFSDDPLIATASPIRVLHLTELRTRVDVLRARFGLAPFSWTNPSLIARTTVAAAVHVSELRMALQQAYTAAGQLPPTFTDSPLVPFSTSIRGVHIQQLRDAVIMLEAR